MTLWAMPCRATQDGQVIVESSDKMWSTGDRSGKPLQYSCLENPMNSMKRQKDKRLKDELPRSVGAQYATGDQFSSIAQLCLTLCDPMDCSTPGLPVHHQLLEFTQTHVHWVGDAIQQSHPLSSPSPPPSIFPSISVFSNVNSSHPVAKVLEFQLQHQSFQWIFKTDFL